MGKENPAPASGDFSRSTFEGVMGLTTGSTAELKTILDAGRGNNANGEGWLSLTPSFAKDGGNDVKEEGTPDGGAADDASDLMFQYTAFNYVWVSINVNRNLMERWNTNVEKMDHFVHDLMNGKAGHIDIQMLANAEETLDRYVGWLDTNSATLQQWVNKLTSDDPTFDGKAASVIREKVRNFQFIISDLRDQIVEERHTQRELHQLTGKIRDFASAMGDTWQFTRDHLMGAPAKIAEAIHRNVLEYLIGFGVVTGPEYVLDQKGDGAKEYVQETVQDYSTSYQDGLPPGFPEIQGPLNSAATWRQANDYISGWIEGYLEPLNSVARIALQGLAEAYKDSKFPLMELEAPQPPVSGGSDLGGSDLGGGPDPKVDVDDMLNDLFGDQKAGPDGGPGGQANINESLKDLYQNQDGGLGGGPGGQADINESLKDLYQNQDGGPGGGPGGQANVNESLKDLLGNQDGGPGGGPGGQTDVNESLKDLYQNQADGPNGGSNLPGWMNGPYANPGVTRGPGLGALGPGGSTSLDGPGGGYGRFKAPVDANGNRTPVFDANGNPIPVDANGDLKLPLNAKGNPPPVFDKDGNPVSLKQLGTVPPPGGGYGESNLPDLSDLYDNGDFPAGGRDMPERDLEQLLNGGNDTTNQQPNGSTTSADLSDLTGGSTDIPAGGSANIPDDIGGLTNGGGSGDATTGATSDFPVGGGAGGPGSGSGSGFSGEGWSNWSGQEQSGQGGQGFGGSSMGAGGRPFMPPMMPPIMPPQGAQGDKDRERQTWLSEDEEVWGTAGTAVGGVIGLPDGPSVENEEQRAPTHVHVRATAPDRQERDERDDDPKDQSTQQPSEGAR